MKKRTIYYGSIIFLIIDQISKLLVMNSFPLAKQINIILDFFSLMYVKNYGAAFSILIDQRLFLIIVTGVVLFIINHYFLDQKTYKRYEIVLYSMIIGGILGNLIDRIIHGFVVDFLSFKIFNYYFPTFNLADSFIVIGIIILLIINIRGEINERN